MSANLPVSRLAAVGQLASLRARVERLQAQLQTLPHWEPSAALSQQCSEVQRLLTNLEQRLEQPLVTTLLGPTGSGKSTLLSALAGQDDLSPSGTRRPTTIQALAYCRRATDARGLQGALGPQAAQLAIKPGPAAPEHVLLIDTPDADSVEGFQHIPLLQTLVDHSDVLVCLFDAENPKRRDQLDFLAPIVRRFDGASLLVVLNRCDRQSETELREQIVPDFQKHLGEAWPGLHPRLLCVSARAGLVQPGWDPAATPRHGLNELPLLRHLIFGALADPGRARDLRLANAEALGSYLAEQAVSQARRDQMDLNAALGALADAESQARGAALACLAEAAMVLPETLTLALHAQLAQRWLGPVGWLVALWSRLLHLGTGLFAWRHPRQRWRQAAARSAAPLPAGVAEAAAAQRSVLLRHWPDVTAALARGRFTLPASAASAALVCETGFEAALAGHWSDALQQAVALTARRLSHPLLQLFLNLPAALLLLHTGWVTLRDFWLGAYRPLDFFVHAFLALAVLLVAGFFAFQLMVRFSATPRRLARHALRLLGLPSQPAWDQPPSALVIQVHGVLALAGEIARPAFDQPSLP